MKFVEEEVVERGLRCVFVKTNIDTAESNRWRVPLQMHAMMDEMTTSQYAENIRAAHEGLFLKGHVVGSLPYGYMGIEVEGMPTRQNKTRRKVAIDPETSVWVQKIFHWFVTDRVQNAEILRRLNDQQAPLTPHANGYWTEGALAILLRNECYRGLFSYGKGTNVWQSNKDYSKRVLRDKPLREATFEDLRLIPNEIWFRAQEIMAAFPQNNAGRKPKDANSATRPRLLNGLLWCTEHDAPLKVGGTYGHNMYCSKCRNVPKAKRPLYSYVNRAQALQATCQAIADVFRADDDLVAQTIAAFQRAASALQQPDSRELDKLRNRSDRLSSQIQFVLSNPGETEVDRDESNQRLKQLRTERTGILAEIARREAALQRPITIPSENEVRLLIGKLEGVLLSAAQGNEPEDVGTLRQILEIMTGGQIKLEQVGERRAYRGFLRGRFNLDLISALQNLSGLGTGTSQNEPVEVVVDYREPAIAERHMAKVKELWDSNMLITSIAEKLGIDRHDVTDAIRIWHERNGLPVPPDGRVRRASVPEKRLIPVDNTALIDEIKRHYDDGLLICEIAKKVGRERTTVRKYLDEWFRAHGIRRHDGRNRRKELPIKNRSARSK